MCAAVEAAVKHPAVNGADKRTKGMLTASFEARQLFNDDGRQRGFAPGSAARAMPGLREQRKTRQFCDVVFRATDGAEIWAHRFVMSAKYSGCYALFTLAKESMAPEQRKQVGCPPIRAVIKDLEGSMIELLVDFAYHIQLHERIGTHNIVEVLELSEVLKVRRRKSWTMGFLKLRSLVEALMDANQGAKVLTRFEITCLKTLKQDLEPENSIETYHLATRRGYDNLAKEALRYTLRNFDQVWKNSAQFEALTPEEMRSILEDNRLNAPSEVEETFQAIIKWISADAATRKGIPREVPASRSLAARFTTAYGTSLTRCFREFETVVTHPQVHGDEDSLKVLNVIHQTLIRRSMEVGKVAGIDLSPRQWLTPRLPKHILFLFGGWTTSGATNNMITYNCRAQKWRVMGSQCTTPRAHHGAAVIDSSIYFVGGYNGHEYCHSVVCFDVPLARWSAKAGMTYARAHVSVAVLQASDELRYLICTTLTGESWQREVKNASVQGHIYAMGGRDGISRTKTVERYDIEMNHWSMVADMNEVRSGASAAAARGRIYIVEFYDPSTNAWTRIATMTIPRSSTKVLAYKDALYIIGGYNDNGRLSSMELLDIRRARFSELPSMPYAKSHFAAAVLDGCIYTIGGWNGRTTLKLVEKYDVASRTWFTAPEVSADCWESAACVVEDIADPTSWI
ncbi:hypothetical protein MTO96_029399 [Rhipicephalus appendiculatus]